MKNFMSSCVTALVLALACSALFAHGKKDVEEKFADTPASWQERFNLSEKKKGKYNVLITASDFGGNRFIEGPYNLYVDPNSDLPVCGITNPKQNMRVIGNLNIVGTCIDDDAVEYVELVLDGDAEHPVRANGKDFWSYYLDTTELSEGPHTITATGYDSNALASAPVTFTWHLDRRAPVTAIDNYGTGALVSGKVHFTGSASDGNGIKEIAYSVDNGAHFQNVKFRSKNADAPFSVPVDTGAFQDGPAVIWFRTKDQTGSVGIFSFLCFIDNTKPEAAIIYPEKGAAQSGKFLVSGSASDALALERLTWKFGNDSGSIDLIPGNPYWGVMFDASGSKDKSRKFELSATDRAGNVTVISQTIALNPDADKPKVRIFEPAAGAVIAAGDSVFVRGIAHDDDGIASVKYRIDENTWIEESTKGVFSGTLAAGRDLETGTHRITVIAKDRNGTESAPTSVTITASGGLPVFSEPKLGAEPFINGMTVHPEAGAVFRINVSGSKGLLQARTEITWGDGGAKTKDYPLNGKKQLPIEIPIKADFPKGVVKIRISAADMAGAQKELRAFLFVTDTSSISVGEPHVVFEDSLITDDGVAVNHPAAPVTGFFTGGKAVRAEIVPPTPFVTAALDGNMITLVPGEGRGVSEPFTVRVHTDQGLRFDSRQLVFQNEESEADTESIWLSAINGNAYRSGMTVELAPGASVTAQAVIKSSENVSGAVYEITGDKVPGGAERQAGNAVLKKNADNSGWTAEFPLANLPARMNKIRLTVNYGGGRSKSVTGFAATVRPADAANSDNKRGVYAIAGTGASYDAAAAQYRMNADGKIYFFANTPELKSAELLSYADSFSLEQQGNTVTLTGGKDGIYSALSIRVTDAHGISYSSEPLNIIVDSGMPDIRLSAPEKYQWVKNTLKVSGTAAAPAGLKSGEFSIDGGQNWQPLALSFTKGNIGATFSADVDIASLEDGLVRLDVRITASGGGSATVRTAVQKDTQVPEVTVLVPAEGAAVNGTNLIAFNIKDAGSFEKAFYLAPDNGKDNGRIELGEPARFMMTYVGTKEQPLDPAMAFLFTDDAGNSATLSTWHFSIDADSDLPRTEIHIPAENEVITRDFTVSGVALDDDGACTIFYKLDNGEYQQLPESGTGFAVALPFKNLSDNEHTVSVYAVDANGLKGNVTERTFRVSTEEPKGTVETPSIDSFVKNIVTVSGSASDKNGIEKVQLSFDNGNTYNDVQGTENWSYTFDSKSIPDGVQAVFLKVVDKCGIEGLYSSILNIDNTKPELALALPQDYSNTAGMLFFSGYAEDNVAFDEAYISIRSFEGKTVPKQMQKIPLQTERIIAQTLDLSALENGSYSVELTVSDKAGNLASLSRYVVLDKNKPAALTELLYPLNGDYKQGAFNISGQVTSENKIDSVALFIDGSHFGETEVSLAGYFTFNVTPDMLSAGAHSYKVEAKVAGGASVSSEEQTLTYSPHGAWVTVDNFSYGDFAVNRPYITGRAGYAIDEEELTQAKAKGASKEQRQALDLKKVQKVEISFDNGRTFKKVSSSGKWRCRIENLDMEDGFHFMLVRATMKNGEIAADRSIIRIDNKHPSIHLISPNQGGRYNEELEFAGLAEDNVGLRDVKMTLRKGDAASYQIPSFIQGLYLDMHFWGATLFDIGVGLTFFDDNVKVQFQWGQFTQAQRDIFSKTDLRYGGDNVMGIKILANVTRIPFSFFLGRDWDWLSATVAIGADFTRFDESASGKPQILSALIAQIEFPRVKLQRLKAFSSFALYTEGSLWFIPTDVTGTVKIKNLIPQISEGIRVNVF